MGADELLRMRADFLRGQFEVRVEEQTFRLRDYQAFLDRDAEDIAAFRAKQRAAFAEERERWAAAGQNLAVAEPEPEVVAEEVVIPNGSRGVSAHLPGSVWQVVIEEGASVAQGDKLVIVESMKMETAIVAPCAGKVRRVLCAKGRTVEPGQMLVVIEEEVR